MDFAHADVLERLKSHVRLLGGEIGERNVVRSRELEAAARCLEHELRSYGYTVREQQYRAYEVAVRNLFVEKPGASKQDEVIVVGAHYDSVLDSPGANDNGSGVAAVLELARAFAAQETVRTLQFALFVNEEPPFFQSPEMGSYIYAKRLKLERRNVVGMLSLETIGCYSDEPGSQQYPSGLPDGYPTAGNFIGFAGFSSSEPWIQAVISAFRNNSTFPAEVLVSEAPLAVVGWSDHWSFSQMGYPALMVTDTAPFRYPYYHSAQDTPDKLDYERMARVVAGLRDALLELANP